MRTLAWFAALSAVAAAFLITSAIATADPPQPVTPGPYYLELTSYCQAHGWETAIIPRGQLAPHAAVENWRCATGDASLPINMEQACKWQYGIDAIQARFLDLNDAYSWVCYTVGHP